MKTKHLLINVGLSTLLVCGLSSCLAAAAGVGAETAYVSTQKDQSTGEVMTDQRITAEIKTKLLADQTVPGMDVNVDTENGHVTLRGVLRNDSQVTQALKIAKATSGVKSVKSELYVN